jgi:hypothetical protein
VTGSAAGTGSRRLLLHVGTPKSGTSFVQDVLFSNRAALAARGLLYPADRFDEHFLAALDLMELPWGGLEQQAVGAWDRVAERVRDWPATSVVSHEILARASPPQVRRALESVGDTEVHLVLSARDLARQIPAEWQENVKHRRTLSYADFLDRITDRSRADDIASWFWAVQEVPDILERWGETLPPERVHVVTVPQPGASPTLLWERFAGVLGLDPDAWDTTGVSRANPSLGVPETAFLRMVNRKVNGGVLAGRHYREFVRELLAHRTLSQFTGSPRLGLPEEVRAWTGQVAEGWVTTLAERGYDVVGDLDELRPAPAHLPFTDPDRPAPRQVLAVAVQSTVTLIQEAAALRDTTDTLRAELATAVAERDQARREVGAWLRFKRRVVAASADTPVLRVALGAYRRLRGR